MADRTWIEPPPNTKVAVIVITDNLLDKTDPVANWMDALQYLPIEYCFASGRGVEPWIIDPIEQNDFVEATEYEGFVGLVNSQQSAGLMENSSAFNKRAEVLFAKLFEQKKILRGVG